MESREVNGNRVCFRAELASACANRTVGTAGIHLHPSGTQRAASCGEILLFHHLAFDLCRLAMYAAAGKTDGVGQGLVDAVLARNSETRHRMQSNILARYNDAAQSEAEVTAAGLAITSSLQRVDPGMGNGVAVAARAAAEPERAEVKATQGVHRAKIPRPRIWAH